MKHIPALLTTAIMLLCLLTACGNNNTNGADTGAGSPSVSDGLKTDPATGTRYTGRIADDVARYGNGYGNTNADKRAGGTSSDAVRGEAALTRYEQMLDNARVHDADGFLLDGENAQHDTLR